MSEPARISAQKPGRKSPPERPCWFVRMMMSINFKTTTSREPGHFRSFSQIYLHWRKTGRSFFTAPETAKPVLPVRQKNI